LREAGLADLSESASQTLEAWEAGDCAPRWGGPEDARWLKLEKILYVVMVPVLGKKAPIGLLVLGAPGRAS